MLRGYFLRLLRTKQAIFVLRKGRREEEGGMEREWKGQAESMEAEGDGEAGEGEEGEDYGAHYNDWI